MEVFDLIIKIVIGILALGLVVLVHETGHFLVSRLMGVEVEAFSIGWGKTLFSWKRGKTTYRIALFPLGGSCKMKGEESFKKAVEEKADSMDVEPGSYYSINPWKRMLIAIAGPFFNLFFCALLLASVALIGYSVETTGNKVLLLSDYPLTQEDRANKVLYPADKAGIKTGDEIVSINGNEVGDFTDIRKYIVPSANERLSIVVMRDGQRVALNPVSIQLDKETGAGRLGIYSWQDPIISSVVQGSPADIAGIKPGDKILTIDGKKVANTTDISQYFLFNSPQSVEIGIERKGIKTLANVIPIYSSDHTQTDIGFQWKSALHTVAPKGFGEALLSGVTGTYDDIGLTIKGIGLLFQGVDLKNAVMGPVRTIYLVGEVATQETPSGPIGSIVLLLQFLAFINIALFIMNLLPIPILDGGQVVLFLLEAIIRRQLKPRFIYNYQLIGVFFVIALFIFAFFNDFRYIFNF